MAAAVPRRQGTAVECQPTAARDGPWTSHPGRCWRWRSARRAACSPPAAATARHGCGGWRTARSATSCRRTSASSSAWPSARTAPSSPPVAGTTTLDCGASPTVRSSPRCPGTTTRCTRWPTARTVNCSAPPGPTAPYGSGACRHRAGGSRSTGRQNDINDLAVSADGQFVATGTDDGRVRLWHMTGGICSIPYRDHTDAVFGVGFSSDGRLLAIGGVKGTVQLRRMPDGLAHVSPAGAPHSGPVRKVVFSHDNVMLATSAAEGRIRLWRVADAARHNTLASPTRTVAGLVFARDDSLLVTAGGDETMQVWDLAGEAPWQDRCSPAGPGSCRRWPSTRPAVCWPAGAATDGPAVAIRRPDPRRDDATRTGDGCTAWRSARTAPCSRPPGRIETVRVWRVSDGTTSATLTGHRRRGLRRRLPARAG